MQISVIIGIVLSLFGGELAANGELDNFELPLFLKLAPGRIVALTVGSIIVYSIILLVYNRMIRRKLLRGRFRGSVSQIINFERILVIILSVVISYVLGWGRLTIGVPGIYLLHEMVWVSPFVILLLAQLFNCYGLDIAARGAMEGFSESFWTLREYMVYHIRHNLLTILVPLAAITLLGNIGNDLVEYISARSGYSLLFLIDYELTSLISVLITFSLAPILLRYAWATSPLADGEVREKLIVFSSRIKLRYSQILSWHTYSMVGNAAVTGIFPFLRYVIISDRLLADLSPEQLCAVFGHEAGHIRHKHMPLMLLSMIAIMVILGWLSDMLLELVPTAWPLWVSDSAGLVLLALIVVVGGLVFGYISRNFEREADVYGAIASGDEADIPDGRLSSIGSAIMSSALNRLACVNGMSVSKRSYRHGSLADRMGLLYELAVTPGAMLRFTRKLRVIKLLIIAGFVLAMYLSFSESL